MYSDARAACKVCTGCTAKWSLRVARNCGILNFERGVVGLESTDWCTKSESLIMKTVVTQTSESVGTLFALLIRVRGAQ